MYHSTVTESSFDELHCFVSVSQHSKYIFCHKRTDAWWAPA